MHDNIPNRNVCLAPHSDIQEFPDA